MKKAGRQKKQTGADGDISRPRTTSPASLSIPFRGLAWLAVPSTGEREAATRINHSDSDLAAFNVNCGKCLESAAISELHRTKQKWCGEAGVR